MIYFSASGKDFHSICIFFLLTHESLRVFLATRQLPPRYQTTLPPNPISKPKQTSFRQQTSGLHWSSPQATTPQLRCLLTRTPVRSIRAPNRHATNRFRTATAHVRNGLQWCKTRPGGFGLVSSRRRLGFDLFAIILVFVFCCFFCNGEERKMRTWNRILLTFNLLTVAIAKDTPSSRCCN